MYKYSHKQTYAKLLQILAVLDERAQNLAQKRNLRNKINFALIGKFLENPTETYYYSRSLFSTISSKIQHTTSFYLDIKITIKHYLLDGIEDFTRKDCRNSLVFPFSHIKIFESRKSYQPTLNSLNKSAVRSY